MQWEMLVIIIYLYTIDFQGAMYVKVAAELIVICRY